MREIITIRVYFDQEAYVNEEIALGSKKLFFDLNQLMDEHVEFKKTATIATKSKRDNSINSCYSTILMFIKNDLDNINVVIPFDGLHEYDPEDIEICGLAEENGAKKNKERSLKRLMMKELNRLFDKPSLSSKSKNQTTQFVEFAGVLTRDDPLEMDFENFSQNFSQASLESFDQAPSCQDCLKYKEQIQALERDNEQLKRKYDSSRKVSVAKNKLNPYLISAYP